MAKKSVDIKVFSSVTMRVRVGDAEVEVTGPANFRSCESAIGFAKAEIDRELA